MPSGSVNDAMKQTPVSSVSSSNASRLKFLARLLDVVDMECNVRSLLRPELQSEPFRLPNVQVCVTGPNSKSRCSSRRKPSASP